MSTIRILVADNHPVVSEGVALVLGQSPDIEVVGLASGGHEAVRLTRELLPDVLLLDYRMPDMEAPGVIQRLKADGATTAILILTNYEQASIAKHCLSQGALGFVAKSASNQELLDAIHAVAQGRSYLSSTLAASVSAGNGAQGLDNLSARELELLRLMGEGFSLQEAAHKMHVTESTVSTYRQRLMKKLSLRNTAEIIRFAVQQGLLDGLEPPAIAASQRTPPAPPHAPPHA
ncbi:MAG: hypothetical protein DRQ55_14800 [Planctomycetota bacterium]|nr:MAG: hypothetical protein DRQ55_14800 [Planctomycetota bacterium]